MNEIRLFRVGWPVADGRYTTYKGHCYATNSTGSFLDTLPVEFFSHQLMEVDVSDDENLLSFVSTYGIPRHPSRYRIGGMPWSETRYDDIEVAKGRTDSAAYAFLDDDDDRYGWFSTSIEEVKFTIEDIQSDIRNMFKCLSGEVESYWSGKYINAGTAYPYVAHTGQRTFPDHSLTNAICNQVVNTIADEALWKLCACDGCGRLYKRHQPKTGISSKTGKNPSRSKYCSIKCQNRQGVRNSRKSAKERITH